MSNRVNGSVKIGDTEMYYVSFGSGPKKLVVIPGLGDGLATVKGKAFFLAPSYKKFMQDYTVYMFSRKNKMPKGYTIRQMAEDQVTAMHSLGIDKACILGVSQGGMISQYIAIDHPEVVEKLILAVTAPYANDVVKGAVGGWIEMANAGDHMKLTIDTAEKMYTAKFFEKNRKAMPILAKMTKPKSYERFFRNAEAILNFDSREGLSRISCPTYIIAGDDDNTVGNDAPYELSEAIKDSEVFIYKGFGHGAFEECKDFYDKVLQFCNK
ncbi:MAG: alpha/beta hydrolase [Lachnospiraceae bacterium]|nr:alpha/beta hydrolase [Lachnospiraceae bacterium]